jgi:hypothetical protein
MGNLWNLKSLLDPNVASYGAKMSHSLVTDLYLCRHIWSENGHPYVARTGAEVAFSHPKVFPVVLPAAPYLGFLEPDLFPIVSEASTS